MGDTFNGANGYHKVPSYLSLEHAKSLVNYSEEINVTRKTVLSILAEKPTRRLKLTNTVTITPAWNVLMKHKEPTKQIQKTLASSTSQQFSLITPKIGYPGTEYRNQTLHKSNFYSTSLLQPPTAGVINVNKYKDMIQKKVSKDGIIIIITVDYSFVEMALNLYETSLLRFNITNYLFVCSHPGATAVLNSRGVSAVTLWNDTQGMKTSDYETKAFNRKTRYKTSAAMFALDMGYIVLVLDVDIVFSKNPFPYLKCDNKCDIIMQSEAGNYYRNTGFYMAFPTNNTLKMHQLTLQSYTFSPDFNDQQSINGILLMLETNSGMKVETLDENLFPNGKTYFDQGRRMFAGDNPCNKCVIVHNNYIAAFSNKRYRFKEHLLWDLDNNGYYSNKTAKYIMYDNRRTFGEATKTMEENALKTALLLGSLFNRIVILPKFFCYLCPYPICKGMQNTPKCSAYAHFNITIFDRVFYGKYREHAFLNHKKVPENVKQSVSEPIFINTNMSVHPDIQKTLRQEGVKHFFSPSDLYLGASEEELHTWFYQFQNLSIVRFHSLYGNVVSPDNHILLSYQLKRGLISLHNP